MVNAAALTRFAFLGVSEDAMIAIECVRRHPDAVGAPELKVAVRAVVNLTALFVDSAMVPAAEHGEIRERRRASPSGG